MKQLQFNAIFWFICMKYRAASLLFYRVTVTGWLLKARHQGMLGRDSEPGTLNNWFQFENSPTSLRNGRPWAIHWGLPRLGSGLRRSRFGLGGLLFTIKKNIFFEIFFETRHHHKRS